MKRTVAAFLWFLVGWYLGSAAAWAFGLGSLVAPVVAVGLAALVFVDPFGKIWARPQASTATSVPTAAASDPDPQRA